MKKFLLLIIDGDEFFVEKGKKINTHHGKIDTSKIKKGKTKTHLGKEVIVLEPNILDFLKRKAKRGSQVMLPKDIGMILAYTGIKPNSKVVDAGTGSAFSSLFIANFVSNGKVYTYEKNKKFFEIAKKNIKESGIKNIVLKNKDVTKKIDEKNVDLVILDLKDVKKVIKHAYKSLKPGGYLAVYSPTVDELLEVRKEIEEYGFFNVKTIENIVREWQYTKTLRPKTMGITHTGFLTFARKLK